MAGRDLSAQAPVIAGDQKRALHNSWSVMVGVETELSRLSFSKHEWRGAGVADVANLPLVGLLLAANR